ncbi:MAG: type IV pilin protein [Caldimonas sp.]
MQSSPRLRRPRGFTLIETMIAVAVAGILSSIAYPSVEGHVQRARRTDALVSLMQAQLAEERYRANNAAYGTLAEIGVRSRSTSGHYLLEVNTVDGGYEIVASASGTQARDTHCRHLRLSTTAAGTEYASGADRSFANPAAINRRCWNR